MDLRLIGFVITGLAVKLDSGPSCGHYSLLHLPISESIQYQPVILESGQSHESCSWQPNSDRSLDSSMEPAR